MQEMPAVQKQGSVPGIQYLRGIAALAVVLCHYGQGLSEYPQVALILSNGALGVHLFFLVSGFIIVYSMERAGYRIGLFPRFLLKRSARIDPPYFVTILLIFLLFRLIALWPGFQGKAVPFDPLQLLAHIFYVVPFTGYSFYNHIFWTLCVEFQFYVVIGLLYFLYAHRWYKAAFLVAFSLSSFIPWPNSYYLVFTYAPVFALGIALTDLYRRKLFTTALLPGCLACLIWYQFGVLLFVLSLASSLVILFVQAPVKSLLFLGRISYSLYLTHALTFIVISGLLRRWPDPQVKDWPMFRLGIELILAVTVAWLFYLVVERPSLRLSKKIGYGRR